MSRRCRSDWHGGAGYMFLADPIKNHQTWTRPTTDSAKEALSGEIPVIGLSLTMRTIPLQGSQSLSSVMISMTRSHDVTQQGDLGSWEQDLDGCESELTTWWLDNTQHGDVLADGHRRSNIFPEQKISILPRRSATISSYPRGNPRRF